MRSFKRISSLVAVATMVSMLSACMPEDLDVTGLPPVKREIVVSSQVLPDTSLVILLTTTIGALDASDNSDPAVLLEKIGVTDAVVTVSTNGVTYVLPPVYSGVYTTKSLPLVPGSECVLTVKSQAFGEISAKTIVQAPVAFDSVRGTIFYNGFNDFFAEVTYALSDPPFQNFYMINVQSAKQKDRVNDIVNPDSYSRLFDDKNFNGQVFTEMFRTIPKNFHSGDSVAVSLANVNRDYYDFLKLRIVNRFGFVEYFSEPINYPTNVVGGRGFFNVYIPDTHILVL